MDLNGKFDRNADFVTHHMDTPFQASIPQVMNQPFLAYDLYGSLYFIDQKNGSLYFISSAVITIVSTCKCLISIIFICP